MPVRLFGKPSYFKGKSLMELTAKLRNPKGRVVTRVTFLERYPEKSYYILTNVIHDYNGKNLIGTAWGYKVFRGVKSERIARIDSGGKRDWRLIPKDEEEDFCNIDKVYEKMPEPDFVKPFPPLLELVFQRNLKQKEVKFKGVPSITPKFSPKQLME